MKVAIVQPYIFPYLGYFQLINAVDAFVLYDDVHFIKKGWIHRNRILNDGKELMFSIPLKKASQNKLINEIELAIDQKWRKSFLLSIEYSYKKAPFFNIVYQLIEKVLNSEVEKISDLATLSISLTIDYLEIDTKLLLSSSEFEKTRGRERANRLIEITKSLGAKTYVNPQNGKELYSKLEFAKHGVELFFIEPKLESYKQGKKPFVSGLSIIDVMMYKSRPFIKEQLKNYQLI